MKLIATVDKNWAIGYQGRKLVHIPSEERFFRFETMHKTVIMGHNALMDFPSGKPLLDRENIVLTRKKDFTQYGVTVAHSLSEALDAVKGKRTDEVYVIGGASVFEQFLPYCDEAYITRIDYEYDADKYMVNFDRLPEFSLTAVSDEQTYYDLVYEIRKYKRK